VIHVDATRHAVAAARQW